jgi:hypothetical protein
VAAGSRWPQGADADHALLRLGWRLASQARERCRDLTPDELAARPVHMRQPRKCVSEAVAYDLTAAVDGQIVARKHMRPPGLRGDRPLSVEEEFAIPPGVHTVAVRFEPEAGATGARTLALSAALRFERGRVVLITQDGERLVARAPGN